MTENKHIKQAYISTKGRQNPGYQMKKHVTQMTSNDLSVLSYHLGKIEKLSRRPHFEERVKLGKTLVKPSDVMETLRAGNLNRKIIEYNETFNSANKRIEQRVLIRLDKPFQFVDKNNTSQVIQAVANVVICLTDSTLVTGFFNPVGREHRPDPSRYNFKMQVRHVVKGGFSWEQRQGYAKENNNTPARAKGTGFKTLKGEQKKQREKFYRNKGS